jgi:biopolymer transport protein ExbD
MRRRGLFNAATRAVLMLVLVFLVGLCLWRRHPTGFRVGAAQDTCDCGRSDTILLHASGKGKLSIGRQQVGRSALASRLADIYGSRREHVLYLSADSNLAFQEVADVIEIVQQAKQTRSSQFHVHEIPLPEALQNQPGDNLNIGVRLVTPGAVTIPCRDGCYNWWYALNPAQIRFDYLVPAPGRL